MIAVRMGDEDLADLAEIVAGLHDAPVTLPPASIR